MMEGKEEWMDGGKGGMNGIFCMSGQEGEEEERGICILDGGNGRGSSWNMRGGEGHGCAKLAA